MSTESKQPVETPKKASKASFKSVMGSKRFRYGGFSLLLTIIVVAVVVLVNVGVTALDNNWNLKLDVTANKMYDISSQTTNIMKNLKEPIRFIALYPEASANDQRTTWVVELLRRYKQINPGMIEYESVDSAKNPTYANQFNTSGSGISDNSVIVVNANDPSRFRVVDASSMYEFDYDMNTYQQYIKAFIGEQALTNAAVFVSSEDQQRVYFLKDHNEVPFSQYSSYAQSPIEQLNIAVAEMGMTELGKLEPSDILVVNSPQRDISPDERETLKNFLESGGKLLYMREGGGAELENFESLLALFGITVNHDLVIEGDESKYQMGNPTIIIPDMTSNDITSSLISSRLVPVLPLVSSFDITPIEKGTRTITPFLTTSNTAFGKVDLEDPNVTMGGSDLPGPRTVGLTVEENQINGNTTKIVVLGSTQFVSTSTFVSYSGNGDLFFNSIRYLQGTSSAVSIIGKSLLGNRLNVTSTTQLFALVGLVLILIPLVLIVTGLVIWLKRRHL